MRRAAALKESDMSTFVDRSRRPKTMPSLKELEKKLLFDSRHIVREHGKERQVSLFEAVYRVEIAKALKGDQRAIEFAIKRGEAIAAAEAAKEEGRNPHAERAEMIVQAIQDIFAPLDAPCGEGRGDPASPLGPPPPRGEHDQVDKR
jgi:hypothetical protein